MPEFAHHHHSSSYALAPMYGEDRLGFVGFHDLAFVIARPVSAHAPWLAQRGQTLHEKVGGNYTNLTAGVRQALTLFQWTPPGVARRMWVLSDGEANRETDTLWAVVEQARQAYVNVNCVGVGDKFDEPTLRKIAEGTHNGKFVPVHTLRELTNAFGVVFHTNGNGSNGHHRYHPHRAETTILVIDLSLSMTGPMEGKPKVTVVEEAVSHLITFKQQMFS